MARPCSVASLAAARTSPAHGPPGPRGGGLAVETTGFMTYCCVHRLLRSGAPECRLWRTGTLHCTRAGDSGLLEPRTGGQHLVAGLAWAIPPLVKLLRAEAATTTSARAWRRRRPAARSPNSEKTDGDDDFGKGQEEAAASGREPEQRVGRRRRRLRQGPGGDGGQRRGARTARVATTASARARRRRRPAAESPNSGRKSSTGCCVRLLALSLTAGSSFFLCC